MVNISGRQTVWTVSKLSLDGEVVAKYPVGASPVKILSATGEIWVTLISDDSIVRLKP